MKKTITLISIFTLVSIMAMSQSLGLSYAGGTLNNGDTITLFSTNNNASFAINLTVTNNSSSSIDIKVKKTELSIVSGSDNTFCDWYSCFPPSTYVSPNALTLNANETNSSFMGDYNSNDNAGKSTILYTFFNIADTNDSAAVVINFITGSAVGIENNTPIITVSKAYPNPTKDAFYLNYDFSNSKSARVEVINVIGSVVKVQEIQGLSGKTMIDVSNLNNGVYFYSVIVDGKKYVSKKLIIQK